MLDFKGGGGVNFFKIIIWNRIYKRGIIQHLVIVLRMTKGKKSNRN